MISGREDFYIKTGSMRQHLRKSRAHKNGATFRPAKRNVHTRV